MLSRIFIQNFALIQSLDIHLNSGLQVITGETGAGKSIILGALRLILGERADLKSVQNDQVKSIVEAEFTINDDFKFFFEENDLDFEKHTIIRREILPSGKSRSFVNDVPVTLETLKLLSSQLIDIHSQFETSGLFQQEYQFGIIDGLAKNKADLAQFQIHFREFQRLNKELEIQKNQLIEGNKEQDYRSFLLNELEAENLDEVDLEDLQEQLRRQENADAITENLAAIFAKTDQEELGLLDQLSDIKSKLGKVGALSHEFTLFNQRFEEVFLEFKDLLFELQNATEKIDNNPEIAYTLGLKVNAVNALLQKHHVSSVEDLKTIRTNFQQQQNSFAALEDQIAITEKAILQTEKTLDELAKNLSESRKAAIPNFILKTENLLKQLGLEKARIEVALTANADFNKFGKEEIKFLFQANAGFELKPIQNAISGGERSRVMLSMKKLMAENSELPTLILDEIDTGVSGKIAEEMGNVMKEMAKDMQLIVITHLAQVAAKGNDNYKVIKQEVAGKTQSTIVLLSKEEKLQEIAQLLSGSKITDAAVSQAQELMK